MATTRPGTTTKRDRNTGSIKEGGLPKDKETASSGDNRGRRDPDGNRTATKAPKSARSR